MLKNEEFVPKLINKDDRELKLELSYCGKQAMIKRLPINWKEQLIIFLIHQFGIFFFFDNILNELEYNLQ